MSKTDDDIIGVRLTPKGFLATETGLFMEFTAVWDKFEDFCRKQAKNDGYPDGIPCLIFKDGGICMTVKENRE